MATIFDATTLPQGVPVGRLVFGDPFTPEKVMDDKTNTQKLNADGTPMFEYVVGVAYRKDDPVFAAFWAYLKSADKQAWPQFHDEQGQVRPGVKFADKLYDGDGHNTKGVAHSMKEGWAGHWIVKYSTQYAPACHVYNNGWVQTTDKAAIKRGYYVQVTGSTQSNKSDQSPGMYRNASIVALVGYGPEIVGVAADPNKALGNAPPPLPVGASATPLAPATPPVGQPAAPAAAPTLAAPPVAPAAPAAQYTGHMPPAPAAPAAPPAPPAPAFVPGPVMTDKAAGMTREQYHASGWTDELLIQHGYMVA